jgi:hypothetical protein
MTLAELRAQLAALNHLPDDTPVILARDAEGNGYSPVGTVDDALYDPESPWSGQMYATPAMRAAEPGEWDEAPDEAIPAVFLWPTN